LLVGVAMKALTTGYTAVDDFSLIEPLQKKMASLGFGRWIYSAVNSLHQTDDGEVNRISSYPQGFIDDYNRFNFSEVDPSTPYWIEKEYPASYRKVRESMSLNYKQQQLMNLNWDNDVNRGIVIPLRNVLGFKGVLALAYDGSIKDLNGYIPEVQHDLLDISQVFNREFLSRNKPMFTHGNLPKLSDRKTHILSLLAQGLLTKQIADILSISINGVDKHIAHIKNSFRARTTTAAVALAIQWELI